MIYFAKIISELLGNVYILIFTLVAHAYVYLWYRKTILIKDFYT